MTYRIQGILKLPDGAPAANCEIEFVSRKNLSPLVQGAKTNILTSATGAYDVTLELGEYAVIVYTGGTYPAQVGTILLSADTVAGQDLPSLLQHDGWIPATPDYVQQIENWVASASQSAANADASADAAADSAERAALNGSSVVSREALRRSYAEAGFTLVDGSFEEGGTLTSASDVLLHKATAVAYAWSGAFPKVVSAGSTPATSGGVGVGAWVDRTQETLKSELSASSGASLVGTSKNKTIETSLSELQITTSSLGITTFEGVTSVLSSINTICVDSDLTLSSAVEIPTGAVIKNLGGTVTITSSSAKIEITPNIDINLDVNCGSYSPDGLFYVDGKRTTPMRWYVGEHDTRIKAQVISSVSTGTCLLFDAVCSLDARALISGIKADITLSKMQYGSKIVVDRTAYVGAETGNAYITSNEIKLNCAGTIRPLHEQYSGDGTTKPSNEEIAANYYEISHQPKAGVANYPMKMVGRLQRAVCNFWDNSTATNTSDQIQIYGNDCDISGPNLPALNSGYVTISGSRVKYSGVTYGTPEDVVNRVKALRGLYIDAGASSTMKVGGLISATSQSVAIRGTSSSDTTTLLTKTISPLANQYPVVVEIDVCANMLSSYPYNVVIDVNGYQLVHAAANTGGIINRIIVTMDADSISISSNVGTSSSSIQNAALSGDLTFTVKAYSNINSTDAGYVRSTTMKAFFGGI